MYFCVNNFEVGVNDSLLSGNQQQKVQLKVLFVSFRLYFMWSNVNANYNFKVPSTSPLSPLQIQSVWSRSWQWFRSSVFRAFSHVQGAASLISQSVTFELYFSLLVPIESSNTYSVTRKLPSSNINSILVLRYFTMANGWLLYSSRRFYTDQENINTWFNLNLLGFINFLYVLLGCDQVFTSDSGEILSPNYPGQHPQPMQCDYNINVTSGKSIRLTFEEFNLEEPSGNDILKEKKF